MTRFPRPDYASLSPYDPGRSPIAVDLSDNTNLWGPHPGALRAVREAEEEVLTRYPGVYADSLKAAISEAFEVPVETVTTGCGSDDLLDSIFRAASPGGGAVTFPDPTFSMIGIFARMNGLDPVAVPWSRAEAEPTSLLENDPALVYVCRPNNPTGVSLSPDWIDELLEAAGEDGPVIAVDEAYADFAAESLLRRGARHRRLMVLRTLSKAYGLAGLRVGFAVAHPEVAAEAEKSRGPYKVNHLAQRAAVVAVRDREGWVQDITRIVIENRARLLDELEERGLEALPSNANFLLVRWPPGDDERPSLEALMAGLKDRGVAVRPFPDLPELGDTFRVTIGPWPMMTQFLEALESAGGLVR